MTTTLYENGDVFLITYKFSSAVKPGGRYAYIGDQLAEITGKEKISETNVTKINENILSDQKTEKMEPLQNLITELAAYEDRYTAEITAVLQRYQAHGNYEKMGSDLTEIQPDGVRFIHRWEAPTRHRFLAVVYP